MNTPAAVSKFSDVKPGDIGLRTFDMQLATDKVPPVTSWE